jgi:hypothetical protein
MSRPFHVEILADLGVFLLIGLRSSSATLLFSVLFVAAMPPPVKRQADRTSSAVDARMSVLAAFFFFL